MKRFSRIVIIYNPTSTGSGQDNANYAYRQLRKSLPGSLKISIVKTEYAGHAQQIGADYAKLKSPSLLISSSGDGGYHDLVNGVLSVKNSTAITSVLPSGNANDHFYATGESRSIDQLISNIKRGQISQIDALKITSKVNGQTWTHYAHSYIGIGVSPHVGKHLNQTSLNAFNQVWLLIRHILSFKYTELILDGQSVRYSSLVFSVIPRMSKVLTLADTTRSSRGKFDISALRYRSHWRLLTTFIKASLVGLRQSASMRQFEFKTIDQLPIQLDGEIYQLDASSKVKIESAPEALSCIV